jgi:inner membrane protein
MASIGHVAIGMAAARHLGRRRGGATLRAMIGWSALSMLPDADVVGFAMGVPYGAPWGHRGATHSLVFALLVAVVAGACTYAQASGLDRDDSLRLVDRPRRALRIAVYAACVVASHGLLDAMTDGGKGIALLWPFTTHRFFFGWRPIPVAPIGVGFLSLRGARVAAVELVEFSPFFAYALTGLRRRA